MLAGQLNRVVNIEIWQFTQDDGGGVIGSVQESWQQRANVEDRTGYRSSYGSQGVDQAQQQWEYQYKFVLRYIRPIQSNYTIVYDGYRYTIDEVALSSEGHKRFYHIVCRKGESWQTES